MEPNERKDFGVVIAGMAATFGREVDQAMLEGYWLGLGDLPLPAIQHGAGLALRNCKFMPTVREIRELAGVPDEDTRAALAFEYVRDAIARVSYYNSIVFDDPAITATIRNLGGWMRLCELPREELEQFVRPRFERLYKSFSRTGVSEEQAGPLLGFVAQQNGANGFESPAPKYYVTGLEPARVIETTCRFGLVDIKSPALLEQGRGTAALNELHRGN